MAFCHLALEEGTPGAALHPGDTREAEPRDGSTQFSLDSECCGTVLEKRPLCCGTRDKDSRGKSHGMWLSLEKSRGWDLIGEGGLSEDADTDWDS